MDKLHIPASNRLLMDNNTIDHHLQECTKIHLQQATNLPTTLTKLHKRIHLTITIASLATLQINDCCMPSYKIASLIPTII